MNVTYTINEVSKRPETDRRARKSVIYVHVTNQDFAKPVAELFSGWRRNNPFRDYREQVLPKAFPMLGLPSDTKVRWSQKAGCSCGCSPGFVIVSTGVQYLPPTNFWVDINMNIEVQTEMFKVEDGKVTA